MTRAFPFLTLFFGSPPKTHKDILQEIGGATIIKTPEKSERKEEAYHILKERIKTSRNHRVHILGENLSDFLAFLQKDPSTKNLLSTPFSQSEAHKWLEKPETSTPQETAQIWGGFFANAHDDFWESAGTHVLEEMLATDPACRDLRSTLEQALTTIAKIETPNVNTQASLQNHIQRKLDLVKKGMPIAKTAPTAPNSRIKTLETTPENLWLANAFLSHLCNSHLDNPKTNPEQEIEHRKILILLEMPLQSVAGLIQTQDSLPVEILLMTSEETEGTGIHEYSTQILLAREEQPTRWILKKPWTTTEIPFKIQKK